MDTPASLLQRLRLPAAEVAWARFAELYTPLLYYWARQRANLQADEAADLVQEVFAVLLRKLPEFRYDPGKSFRGWLRTVLLNTWREQQRRRQIPTSDGEAIADAAVADPTLDLEEMEYRRHLVHRALRLMQAEFQPTTWKACWEYVVASRPVEEVAADLGVTTNAVYLAKSRVLQRLREELQGLLEE
jgi:RNA polymerase sigma-70 factor (ECF subfamily)